MAVTHIDRSRARLRHARRVLHASAQAALLTLVLTSPTLAQDRTAAEPGGSADGFRWADGPSLRVGDALRLDLHARAQSEIRLRDTGDTPRDQFAWGNRRVGVEGVLFKRVEFQIERELREDSPWRDVFADVKFHRALRVRAGHFKVPFSLERTTSAFNLDFLARATPVADLAPGRETGVMVHGRAVGRLVEYQVGVFQIDAPRVESPTEDQSTQMNMVSGRVIVTPVRDRDGDSARTLRIGLAVTDNRLPQGTHDSNDHFDSTVNLPSEDFYINGRRRRYALEGLWSAGRLSVKGELLQQADSRLGEAVTGGDLSDLVLRGGYVSGVWRLVGDVDRPRHAVDLAARLDRLTFGSADSTEEPSISPRANHVAPLRKDTWTIGVNWLVTQWVKVQVNAIREQLADPLQVRRHTLPGASWASLMGVQFSM